MRWTKVTGYSVFARSSDSLSVENGKLNEKAKRLSLFLGPQSIPVVYISKERLSRWGLTTTRARKCPRSKRFEVFTSCHFYIIREALREMLNCLREHCRYSTAWTQLAWHGLISLPFWSEQVKATEFAESWFKVYASMQTRGILTRSVARKSTETVIKPCSYERFWTHRSGKYIVDRLCIVGVSDHSIHSFMSYFRHSF